MTRTQFDRGLEEVRSIASRMGVLVEDSVRRAVESLLSRDPALAASVIEDDAKINALHLQLREEVFMLMSTQAPVARDLRLLLGVQYIGAELERMGDYAARIAKRARDLADEPESSAYVEIGQMSDLVEKQVHDIIDAFIRVDCELATAVAGRDDAIDTLYRQIFASELAVLGREPERAMKVQYILNIAHTLERIGDRVTNVAEDIVFLDTGQVVELD